MRAPATTGVDDTRRRRGTPPQLLIAVAATTVAALSALVAMATASGLTVGDAVADPHEFHRYRFLGIVSTTGVLVWGAVVTICVFTAVTIGGQASMGRWRSFFMASAGIALMLLLDDFLLIHEFSDEVVSVFVDFDRTREQKDVLEAAVFAGYASVFTIYAWTFRDLLRVTDFEVLGLALVMFALSLVVDFGTLDRVGLALPDEDGFLDLRSLVEEGFKLLGIVYFATFYIRLAADHLRPNGAEMG